MALKKIVMGLLSNGVTSAMLWPSAARWQLSGGKLVQRSSR
jgi:hypothetical protein